MPLHRLASLSSFLLTPLHPTPSPPRPTGITTPPPTPPTPPRPLPSVFRMRPTKHPLPLLPLDHPQQRRVNMARTSHF
ncbi:hypothetical protein Pmani_022934 [Petrolisthes manimaculis]|uniref:Uncharacterized protein n=1 Tax=Petrolisthes manimaculis TaxID=1843537 RepID=A0AAE1PB59_9EUCA|nr:hypothetical protein Pmani_022934 [Petrolisthes manimaculis]